MAACCSWKTIPISSSSARALLHRPSSSPSASHFVSIPTMSGGLHSARPAASSRFSVQRLTNFSLPVELASMQSLMPLRSVTASALFTSLLSFHNNSRRCLSKAMPEEKEILNSDFNSKMLLKGLSYTELEATPC
ncbi:dual-specificity RNA methyltransferase RlmN isoform X1 [Cucumis melo var. makuwa]|uniref:Dual-specificity RNA methyltransferase RlmN isoform X1 n=1 Tax=Cucumis melo var. makuwa TaxID=1194695 RepID=A0A5D3D8K9_CUCMM|nr:dual-specificity RNA methyltransferase RlmN isoform X1 [Cucumis melo var. makuwa]TYK19892.1 dual-specificity RNA methyltransferase RlmN isoform X1 [Cucumis melo var. makuwa]